MELERLLKLPALAADERLMVLCMDREARDRLQIEVKYEGYLKRQEEQIRLFEKSEEMQIPHDFDFSTIRSLSSEAREKLQRIRPRSIGQASRISGVTVADVSVLMVTMLR
jgi:tRNA uridine 5-carboxymethylaminomethyl modification enzyme